MHRAGSKLTKVFRSSIVTRMFSFNTQVCHYSAVLSRFTHLCMLYCQTTATAMSGGEVPVSEALVQAAASQVAVSQAIAQAVASHAVGNTDEPYSAEVAAIVQTVVSAHMDEVLAARNYQSKANLSYHWPIIELH